MDDMPDTVIAAAWFAGKLNADTGTIGAATLATGGIHDHHAPSGTDTPYVIFRLQSPTNYVMAAGGRDVSVDLIYAVYARVLGNSDDDAIPIARRIKTVLHLSKGEIPEGRILACVAEKPLSLAFVENDREYRCLGQIYRITVQQLAA